MNPLKRMIYNYGVPALGRLLRKKNDYINVIYYHDIVDGGGGGSQHTSLELFKAHMKYLKESGYRTYTFDELDGDGVTDYSPDKVLITFDDGWRSNYTLIFDYMRELGLKYNVFLAAGSIDTDPEYLTWDMVRQMYESGLVGFGAHTFDHVAMDGLSSVDTERQITAADRLIMEKAGIKVLDFCYPFGKYSMESNEYMINDTDYKRIYTSDLNYSYLKGGKIIFCRSSVNNDEPFRIFKHKLSGNFNAYGMLKR